MLAIFDSTGARTALFGVRGDGPGEIEVAGTLFGLDTIIAHLDSERRRVQFFGVDGSVLAEDVGHIGYLPIAVGNDSVLLHTLFSEPDARKHRLVLKPLLGGGTGRQIDPATVPGGLENLGRRGQGIWPPAAIHRSGIVVGDGFEYLLGMVGTVGQGRTYGLEVSPRLRSPIEQRMRNELLDHTARVGGPRVISQLDSLRQRVPLDRRPHFFGGGLGFLDDSTVIVVGRVEEGAFVDFFVGELHAGRLQVSDCLPTGDRLVAAVNGPWIAILCGSAQGPEGFAPRLFRLFRQT